MCRLWWQGDGVGGHHLLLKTTDVNLTNMMNRFSMALLNNDLSSIHNSQQPLEPAALWAGLCANQSPNSAFSVSSQRAVATPVSHEGKLDTGRLRNLPKVTDLVNWKNAIPESNSKAQNLNYDADYNPN